MLFFLELNEIPPFKMEDEEFPLMDPLLKAILELTLIVKATYSCLAGYQNLSILVIGN